jgi:putative oxidoreductase
VNYMVLLGRILYAAIFLLSAPNHFTKGYIEYGASHGVPFPLVAVPLAGVIAFAGGLSILLGFRARLGACLLIIFLVPTTFMVHNFWAVTDPTAATNEQVHFMKNLAMLGAALLIAHFGSGPLSIDNRIK